MRAVSLGARTSFVGVALSLAACSQIIGISEYDIDEKLDGSGGNQTQGGSKSDGGRASSGGGTGDAGADTGEGGEAPTAGSGGSAPNGDGGTGGVEPACRENSDCDDTIDCTDDTCSDSGECEHTADDTACASGTTDCLTCQLGIGCVAGQASVQELLVDGSFDEMSEDWVEHSDNYDNNLFVEVGAHSGTRIARFGPAPMDVTEEYADLLQYITIPENTRDLTLTGYYRLEPGALKPASDYTVAAFYELGGLDPFTQFHSFAGSTGLQQTWKEFSYSATQSEVVRMWGEEYTFDLVSHTVGSVFRFDSLSLKATVCE